MQLLFGGANADIGSLDHLLEQLLLAAEIVIDHALVGLGPKRNGINPRAAQPFACKFHSRRIENALAGLFSIARRAPCVTAGSAASAVMAIVQFLIVFPESRPQ